MPKNYKCKDLRGRNFKNRNLRGADFSNADIRGAKFTDADLVEAKFIGAQTGVQKRWMIMQFCISISFVLCSLLAFTGILIAVVFSTFIIPPNFPQDTGLFPYIVMSLIQGVIYFTLARQGFTTKAWTRIIIPLVAVVVLVSFVVALVRIGAVSVAVGAVGAATMAGAVAFAFAVALAVSLSPALTHAGAVTSVCVFVLAFTLADYLAFAPSRVLAFVPADAIARAITGTGAIAITLAKARVTAIIIALSALLLSLYVAWRSSNEDKKFELARSLGLWLGMLGGTSFKSADLSYADFQGVTLSNCDFTGATVTRTRFKDAKQLKWARLENTILNDTALRNLLVTGQGSKQNYRGKNLQGVNLAGANLCGADFTEADISDADLHGANLKNSDLTRSRFVGCNLRDAVVENAIVTDIDAQGLQGLPKPPEQLRVQGNNGQVLLTDFQAKEFFNLPSIVELYITRELSEDEIAVYYLHLAEMRKKGVATDVYFVNHHHENGGSMLRFQAKSYDAIYQVLPDLLAPFRMAEVVDWKQTLQAIPVEDRGEAITALAVLETKPPVVAWHFARRMAEIFDCYHNAKVEYISQWGRSRRIYIEIVENPEEVKRLSDRELSEPRVTSRGLYIEMESSTINIIGGDNMSEQHFYGGYYPGCNFGDYNSLINYLQVVDGLDTIEDDFKQKLKKARQTIENIDLPDKVKADIVDNLKKLTAEMENPEKDLSLVQRYWNRIKEAAPTVASILASAASLAKLIGGG